MFQPVMTKLFFTFVIEKNNSYVKRHKGSLEEDKKR